MSGFFHPPGIGRRLQATVPSAELGGSMNLGASADEPTNSPLYIRGHVFGNVPNHSSGIAPAIVRFQFTDAAKVTGSQDQLYALMVALTSSTGAEGQRAAIQGRIGITGTFDGTVEDYLAHVAGQFIGFSSANQAGTGGGAPEDYRGGLFGLNPNVWLAGGATFYNAIMGMEVDVSIESGASAFNKYGVLVVLGSIDVNQAEPEGDDAAFAIASQNTSNYWRHAFLVGTKTAVWPLGPDSTVLGAKARTLGCGPCPTPVAKYGVDFRDIAFESDGAAFISDGYMVGPAGELLHRELVVADPDGRALTADESGTVFTNEGTTARDDFTLPTAVAGLTYTFVVQDTDGIRVIAASGDTIRVAGSVSATAGRIDATTIGNTVTLVAINTTEWVATSVVGAWTVT